MTTGGSQVKKGTGATPPGAGRRQTPMEVGRPSTARPLFEPAPHRKTWLGRADQTGIPLALARLLMGVLFVWMGSAKIQDPINFLKLMRQYHILDEQSGYWAMNLIAVVLPWMEVVCGAVLLAGVAVRAAGLVSAGMLLVFTPMILTRGLELFHQGAAANFCDVKFDCGCGAGEVFVCSKLLENSALLLAAVIAILSRSQRFCLSGLWCRHPNEPAAVEATTG